MRYIESYLLETKEQLLICESCYQYEAGFCASVKGNVHLVGQGATIDEALDELDQKIHTYSFPIDHEST